MYREFDEGEYYHALNRGINKSVIFRDDADRRRFLFILLYFQAPDIAIPDVGFRVKEFRQTPIIPELAEQVVSNRAIELTCFALMDNHFHLCLRELKQGGISKYMQRVQNSYTKYFNTRHESSGHLFQGPYKIVHVDSDNQLLHLSAYIHRNPRELSSVHGREYEYEWSSYQDYTKTNRWGDLLVQNIILDQFKNPQEYKKYMRTSSAKLLDGELALED